MPNFNYDKIFNFLELSYNDLTIDRVWLKWDEVNDGVKKLEAHNDCSPAENVFLSMLFPLLKKKFL